jgi:hypothetical protein
MKIITAGLLVVTLLAGLLVTGCSNKPESATTGTAIIEIDFTPNPVPCQDSYWVWQMTITENNGVGATFYGMTISSYSSEKLLSEREELDKLPALALKPYGRMTTGGRIPCQEITHWKYVLAAKDDNGNTVVATGKLEFQPD